MKKIIDGLLYDTDAETAEIILESFRNENDPETMTTERLYRTESGRWFWHLAGGPKSLYAKARLEGCDEQDAAEALLEAGEEEKALEYLEEYIPRA